MNHISIIPAKVMREFRRFLVENNIESEEQLETALRAGNERICLVKEKAPVKGLEEKQ